MYVFIYNIPYIVGFYIRVFIVHLFLLAVPSLTVRSAYTALMATKAKSEALEPQCGGSPR